MHTAIRFRHNKEWDLPELEEVLSRQPGDGTLTPRQAYRHLLDIDEQPEKLPLAHHIIRTALDSSHAGVSILPADFHDKARDPAALSDLLKGSALLMSLDQVVGDKSLKADFLAHQLGPTMLVSGSWLQNLSRVATAHTTVGSELNRLFALQTMAYAASDLEHVDRVGSDLLSLFTTFRETRRWRNIANTPDIREFAFELPLLLLATGLFPREYLPELMGLNLAWHRLGLHQVTETTVLESFLGAALPGHILQELNERNAALADGALRSIELLYQEQPESDQSELMHRFCHGADMLASAWGKWLHDLSRSCAGTGPDEQQAMLALLRAKAPCALGYHRNRKLGDNRIDDLLDPQKHDASDALKHLARSPWIKAGQPERSGFITRLLEMGGPMSGVFSARELDIIRDWISGLERGDTSADTHANDVGAGTEQCRHYPDWSRTDFMEESRKEYANRPCSLRELYYKLVNIEYFPDVLPVAEQFLVDRLNRSFSTLTTGDRPLPAHHYSDQVLEQWVFRKHREQIDAYQPLDGEPRVSREAFIRSTVSLAPLLLIDGGWLQGASALHTLHTPVGLKLFRVFYEEIGEGSAKLHHANIYRELLESMGVDLPDVTDIDFAFSEHFDDDAFEVPVLWLCLSCFTRHYFPELLGTNLAVELAGLGQNYMEAHDTLKHYGFPTTFVDFHNSTDNASVGHAALSMETIKTYMAEVAEREGPHNLDSHWRRIWAGMRLTLPSTSDFYWNPAAYAGRAAGQTAAQPVFSMGAATMTAD